MDTSNTASDPPSSEFPVEGVPQLLELAEKIQSLTIDNLDFYIHTDSKETYTWYDEEDNPQFTYQPGHLWLTGNDELQLPVVISQHSNNGVVVYAEPDKQTLGKLISHDFYYYLFEASQRLANASGHGADVFRVQDWHVPPEERYHLHECIRLKFYSQGRTPIPVEIAFQKAQQLHGPTE